MTYKYYIGIDPGVKTGICIWLKDGKVIHLLETMKIHGAMKEVERWVGAWPETTVWVEDARQATYGRQKDTHKAQGAGSVKRDCTIWEDYLKSLKVDYRMIRPNSKFTKLSVPAFQAMTKWKWITSSHARDACMLVFGI